MKRMIKIYLNYDGPTLTVDDGENEPEPIAIKRQKIDGYDAFKYGAGYYLGLIECMLVNCYPHTFGKSITLENTYAKDNASRFPKSLNLVLPDYLKINGTNTFSFNREINDYLIQVEVTCTCGTRVSDQRDVIKSLFDGINWEERNKENERWYIRTHNIDTDVSVNIQSKENINCTRWEEEKIKKAINEIRPEDIDYALIPKVENEDCTLAEYINRKCIKRWGVNRICIVRGENGYGKTFSMYNAAQSIDDEGHIALFVQAYKLKEYEQSLSRYILNKYIGASLSDISGREAIRMLIANSSKNKKIFIMIDGLDELPYRHYKELIAEDLKVLFHESETVYFVFSTRNSNTFIEKGEIDLPYTELDLMRINPEETNLNDNIKEQLKEYPLLCTPIIISVFKRIENGFEDDAKRGLVMYGGDIEDVSELKNKTDVFEVWIRMLALHAERVGKRGYIYTHLLTYAAYNCFEFYRKNEERYDMERDFFRHASFSDGLEDLGIYESRNFIYPDSIEELIRMFQDTGLMKIIEKGEKVAFNNIEYMIYLAAEFEMLRFKSANTNNRIKLLDEIICFIERESDVRFRALPYALHFFNLVSKKYFSGEMKLKNKEVSKLMLIGLEIGYERTYDVQDNIKKLIVWFKQNNNDIRQSDKVLWCKLIYNINAVTHNMTVQWHSLENPEELLNYVEGQFKWLKRFYDNNENWFKEGIKAGVLPIDFREMIIGNIGAVNQEYAKYYRNRKKDSGHSIIDAHMQKSVEHHMLAYKNRLKMLENGIGEKRIEIGVSRSIISLSTDHFYLGLFHDVSDLEKKNQYFGYAIYGKENEHGIVIPGYVDALNLQGIFSYDDVSNNMSWEKRSEESLYECEPFMIFRRMAGCYYEKMKLKKTVEASVMSNIIQSLHFASSELLKDCMIEGKLSTELLNKYKNEINAFKNDLEKKYIGLLLNVDLGEKERHLLLESFERIIKLYNRINNSNITLNQMKTGNM